MSEINLRNIANNLPPDQRAYIHGVVDRIERRQTGLFQSFSPRSSLKPAAPLATTPSVDTEIAALNAQRGENPVAKAISLLASRDPSFKALDWAEQNRRAGEHVRTLMGGQIPAQVTEVPPGGISAIGGNDVGAAASKILADIDGQPIEKQHAALLEFCSGLAGNGKTKQTASTDSVAKVVASINAQTGPNAYFKCNRYLLSVSAKHRNLPPHEQHRVAGEFTRALLQGNILREAL